MVYIICSYLLLIALIGLAAQLFMGAGHSGHSGGHGHAGHVGHEAGHTHAQHDQSASKDSTGRPASGAGLNVLLTLLSPLMIFSVCLGAGAAGLLIKPLHWPVYEVAEAAALSGIGLYAAIVRPLWQFLFRFASAPSGGLEGAVGSEAKAISKFEPGGRGLISLTIDGQISNNVLAYLDDTDKGNPEAIQPGDILTITSVDSAKNTCRVARL